MFYVRFFYKRFHFINISINFLTSYYTISAHNLHIYFLKCNYRSFIFLVNFDKLFCNWFPFTFNQCISKKYDKRLIINMMTCIPYGIAKSIQLLLPYKMNICQPGNFPNFMEDIKFITFDQLLFQLLTFIE